METVCGFLNSAGGLLIWEAPTTKKIEGKAVCLGDLAPTSTEYQKDQFIGKIADSIIPSPRESFFGPSSKTESLCTCSMSPKVNIPPISSGINIICEWMVRPRQPPITLSKHFSKR